jgi:hypothetical protein
MRIYQYNQKSEKLARYAIDIWEARCYVSLSRALDAMKEFYADQSRELATRLVLFGIFLRRTDTVSEENRSRIMQKMEQFTDLMAESPFVQKQRAAGKEEGLIEGKEQGRIEMLQNNILKIVKARFPRCTKIARQKVRGISELSALDNLFNSLLVATDTQAARLIFGNIRKLESRGGQIPPRVSNEVPVCRRVTSSNCWQKDGDSMVNWLWRLYNPGRNYASSLGYVFSIACNTR